MTVDAINRMKQEIIVGMVGKFVPPYAEGSGKTFEEGVVTETSDKYLFLRSLKGGYQLCYSWVDLCIEKPAVKFC